MPLNNTFPDLSARCEECKDSQAYCNFAMPPELPNIRWRCSRCKFLGFSCTYPETISSSPLSLPYENPPTSPTPLVLDNLNNPFLHASPINSSPPPPSIASSIETEFSHSDPIFTQIYDHNLPWKHDYLTSQTWHAWKVLDHTLRIFKDQGVEIPNSVNNAYNQLRDSIILEYRNRCGPLHAPTIENFIPFIHHAENANALHVSTPPESPPS